jgi:hypothetical protein
LGGDGELNFNFPQRNRTNSVVNEYSMDNKLSSLSMRPGPKNEFIGSLASVLGCVSRNNSMTEEEKELQKMKDGRQRGMSGVDDNSLMQL